MKVFNLTDNATPLLTQRKLVGQTFAVGQILLSPGESEEIDDKMVEKLDKGLADLIAIGALFIGEQPPPAYILAKTKGMAIPPPPPPSEPPLALRELK